MHKLAIAIGSAILALAAPVHTQTMAQTALGIWRGSLDGIPASH